MERLLKLNPHKSSLQTTRPDGEYFYCHDRKTRCPLLTVCITSLQFCRLSTQTDQASCHLKIQQSTLTQTLYTTTTHCVLEVWSSPGSLCSFPSLCWQATRSPAVANPSRDVLKKTKVSGKSQERRRVPQCAKMLSTVMCENIRPLY